jgi:hypothetical protein
MHNGRTFATMLRALALPMLVSIGIGLVGAPGASAAPASGSVIGQASKATSPVYQVPCRMRRVCNRYGCRSTRVCW